MFRDLKPQPPDTILALLGQYRADERPGKIDLGVGVYKDASGQTPILRAVRAAEERMLGSEVTKTYTSLAGEPAFTRALSAMILGPDIDPARVSAVATTGGTGALRQAFELVTRTSPQGAVWVSDPTWPNHLTILAHLGAKVRPYRYVDADGTGFDRAGMLADLDAVRPGDTVLLHGCCHNPTGINPTLADWADIAAVLSERGAMVIVDLAYQGFGDGLEADAAATRLLSAALPELLIAASCSKNFGIYRERTGLLIGVSEPALAAVTQANLVYLNRASHSFPPDHGARIVSTILGDADLAADWRAELDQIRTTMLSLREALAAELRQIAGSDRFAYLAQHRGMFSRLPATPGQIEALRRDHGIYIVGDGRMNVAGLNAATVPILARAMIAAGI